MSVSSRSHAELWPDVCEWFEERSQVDKTEAADAESSQTEATPTGAGAEPESAESGDRAVEAEDVEDDREEYEASATEADDEPQRDDTGDADTADAADGDIEDVDGIGPAYADRLEEAGVTTLAELAEADAAALAAETEVAPNRILSWIEQAEQLTE